MNTILVTGASSGFGLATARYFSARGWRVIATMRRPDASLGDGLEVLPLDVTDPTSIAACVAAAGPIDVLVNNAGIGMMGAFEATPMAELRRLFETNSFGTMAMTQAVLPGMRQRGGGTIVNVTSSVTLADMPFTAPYTASKTAVEGFSGALAVELASLGIRVKLVEPGHAPSTQFAANLGVPVMSLIPAAYAEIARPILEASGEPGPKTTEMDVAETIWRAVHDESAQLRFPAGPDALALWEARQ
jgi:NAD(P)-dependent dehydrogenase (short-subunit alcohol dehydrogenase family)